MKIGIFSNAYSVHQGGGVAYAASFARALAELGSVDLYFPGSITAEAVQELYGISLAGVSVCPPPHALSPIAQRLATFRNLLTDRRYDLVVRQSTVIPGPTTCPQAYLLTEFPTQRRLTWRERQYLKTYAGILANSHFTADWIGRRWGHPATVIHPAVRQIPRLEKRPIVVAIGRFTGGRRSKHQMEMIDAFKQLAAGGTPGWELHLCGAVHDARYLDQVREKARGWPVVVHANLSRAELDSLVGAASIFWHATGVAACERDEPDLMEHFGISTAEAMSAGCVPIVVGRGGLREVVGDDLLEWTWQEWSECVAKTARVIDDPILRTNLAEAARRQVMSLGFGRFQEQVRQLIAQSPGQAHRGRRPYPKAQS